MIHFLFSNKSPQYLFLKADTKEDEKVINELKSKMNLTDPVCYLKSFTGIPFTQDFLYEYIQKSGPKVWYCSIGLWQTIYNFLKEKNWEYDGLDKTKFKSNIPHSFEEFKKIVDSWNLK